MSTFRQVMNAIRRSALIIVICVLVAGAGGVGLGLVQATKYSASTAVLLQPQDLVAVVLGTNPASVDPDRQLQNASVIARSATFLQALAAALGTPQNSWPGLRHQISATPQPGTNTLQLTVTEGSPQSAQDVANTATKTFVTFYNNFILPPDLASRAGSSSPLSAGTISQRLATVDAASPPARVIALASTAPRATAGPLKTGAIGFFAGAVVGFLIMAGRTLIDAKIRTIDDVRQRIPLPVTEASVLSEAKAEGSMARLLTLLGPPVGRQQTRVLGLVGPSTSAMPSEVARRLEMVLEAQGKRVQVIDAMKPAIDTSAPAPSIPEAGPDDLGDDGWQILVTPPALESPLIQLWVSRADILLAVFTCGETTRAEVEVLSSQMAGWDPALQGVLLLDRR